MTITGRDISRRTLQREGGKGKLAKVTVTTKTHAFKIARSYLRVDG